MELSNIDTVAYRCPEKNLCGGRVSSLGSRCDVCAAMAHGHADQLRRVPEHLQRFLIENTPPPYIHSSKSFITIAHVTSYFNT